MELAAMGIPTLVVYATDILTAGAAKILAKVDYVSIPNIMLETEVIPELLFDDFTPDAVAAWLESMFMCKTCTVQTLESNFTLIDDVLRSLVKWKAGGILRPSDEAAGIIAGI